MIVYLRSLTKEMHTCQFTQVWGTISKCALRECRPTRRQPRLLPALILPATAWEGTRAPQVGTNSVAEQCFIESGIVWPSSSETFDDCHSRRSLAAQPGFFFMLCFAPHYTGRSICDFENGSQMYFSRVSREAGRHIPSIVTLRGCAREASRRL